MVRNDILREFFLESPYNFDRSDEKSCPEAPESERPLQWFQTSPTFFSYMFSKRRVSRFRRMMQIATVCHAFVENTPNHKCTFWWNMVDFDGSGGPGVPGTSRGVAYGREMMFREFIHRFHTLLNNSWRFPSFFGSILFDFHGETMIFPLNLHQPPLWEPTKGNAENLGYSRKIKISTTDCGGVGSVPIT